MLFLPPYASCYRVNNRWINHLTATSHQKELDDPGTLYLEESRLRKQRCHPVSARKPYWLKKKKKKKKQASLSMQPQGAELRHLYGDLRWFSLNIRKKWMVPWVWHKTDLSLNPCSLTHQLRDFGQVTCVLWNSDPTNLNCMRLIWGLGVMRIWYQVWSIAGAQ